MMRIIILMIACMCCMLSCSVKEDRTDCPCRMILDFSQVDTSKVKSLNILVTSDDGMVLNEVVSSEDFLSEYVRDVPHGRLRVNVWGGGEVRAHGGYGIVIPYGCECPPLYMDSFEGDAGGESFRKVVNLHKNHCQLTVLIEGMETMPYSLTFSGNVDGYGLDGLPSTGDFSCVAYPGDDGGSQALLPRQLDSSLLLEIDDNSSTVKTFAVGEYIAGSGYDWSAENLDDITIVLDYYVTYIKITIQGWDKEYSYDMIF